MIKDFNVSLLLTFNRFCTLLWCFCCWLALICHLPMVGSNVKCKFRTTCFDKNSKIIKIISFVPNASLLYPLKTNNLTFFWCFQGVEKGCIENKFRRFKFKNLINSLRVNVLHFFRLVTLENKFGSTPIPLILISFFT